MTRDGRPGTNKPIKNKMGWGGVKGGGGREGEKCPQEATCKSFSHVETPFPRPLPSALRRWSLQLARRQPLGFRPTHLHIFRCRGGEPSGRQAALLDEPESPGRFPLEPAPSSCTDWPPGGPWRSGKCANCSSQRETPLIRETVQKTTIKTVK